MAKFEHAPIERHEALAPLSRDHYGGLVQAQHLKKAADADDVARRKAVAEFVDAWDTQIAPHFADEERLLAGLTQSNDRDRLMEEHRHIRSLADKARELRRQTDPAADQIRHIGETLEKHIRWEERELFVRLQQELTEGQLASLAQQTDSIEKQRPRNVCRPRSGESEAHHDYADADQ